MIQPRAVVFDYGQVLCHPQSPEDVEAISHLARIPTADLLPAYWQFRDPYDRGVADSAAYWAAVGHPFGLQYSDEQVAHLVEQDNASWSRLDEPVMAWAMALRQAGLRIGILSNMHPDLRHYLRDHAAWLGDFDATVFSCDVGLIKPEPGIYQEVLRQLGVEPAEALFLDDRLVNVEAARAVGLHALQYYNARRFAQEAREQFALPGLEVLEGEPEPPPPPLAW